MIISYKYIHYKGSQGQTERTVELEEEEEEEEEEGEEEEEEIFTTT
jgi:hypothetical protein